ncbi:hypothetical protein [Pseudomonas delhiensis]|uniref:hypothetical protein n=1 Tax=Pseudomonas delhiensis TaxID=366289 RepID=UPI003159ACD2
MTDRLSSSWVPVTQEQADLILQNLEGFKAIFLQQLREQAKTNELLVALVEVLSESDDDGYDDEPPVYLSGSPR